MEMYTPNVLVRPTIPMEIEFSDGELMISRATPYDVYVEFTFPVLINGGKKNYGICFYVEDPKHAITMLIQEIIKFNRSYSPDENNLK